MRKDIVRVKEGKPDSKTDTWRLCFIPLDTMKHLYFNSHSFYNIASLFLYYTPWDSKVCDVIMKKKQPEKHCFSLRGELFSVSSVPLRKRHITPVQ